MDRDFLTNGSSNRKKTLPEQRSAADKKYNDFEWDLSFYSADKYVNSKKKLSLMPEKPTQSASDRRLAAIMFTDIVGYTSLMQKNEHKALNTIEKHRAVLENFTSRYHGNILQYYGDGSLSIFPSAFEAVECALEIQKELTRDPVVPLRIGIHLGDVMIRGDSVFGDGVNVASRLESLGVAGSIIISDTIYHIIRNQADISTIALGDFTLKGVDHPVPVYALSHDFLSVPGVEDLPGRIRPFPKRSTWAIAVVLIFLVLAGYGLSRFLFPGNRGSIPDDKSIAVLPFNNLSNDPQQEYFSDGITDDIINHLAKISALKVKSRTTTEQYKNQAKTVPVIGRELEVAYILEGSVRKVGNKVRIVAQLIDVKNDIHVWTETFDREMTEIFEIQSEIAIEIAQVLEAQLTNEERRHIRGGPSGKGRSTDITAYDYALRARDIWRNWNDEKDLENALQLLEQAIEMDPSFARGYVFIGHILHYGMRNYGVPTQIWIDQALHMADLAIKIDSTLADAYLLLGDIYAIQLGKRAEAQKNLEKAYKLAPGNPKVLQSLGNNFLMNGEYEKGASMIIKSIERGFSKKDTEYYIQWGDIYHRMMNDYEKAEELYLRAISLAPGWIVPYHKLGQLYRYWGKPEKAEETLSRALEISPLDQEIIDVLAWTNLMTGDLEDAERYWSMYEELEQQFTDASQYVPFRHRLGYVQYLRGDTESAIYLMKEQLKLDLERQQGLRGYGAWYQGGFYYDLAATNAYLGNREEALAWLDSANRKGFISLWYLNNDPLLENIRNTAKFREIQKEQTEKNRKEKQAFKKVLEDYKENLPI